jgi:dTMP kinase
MKNKNMKYRKNLPSGRQGKFIVFEGLDGSGQSTQISLLEKYLKDKKIKVHTTSEPSGNLLGGLIRSILAKQWKLSNTGIQLLYAADRAHHLESEIYPAIEKGNHVISSRYFFSTFAFGSLDNDLEWLEKINKKFPNPDLVIFVRVSPKECMKRINSSRFRKEFFEEEKKLEKIIKVYDKISKSKKYKNFYTVDGERSIEEVFKDVVKIVDKHIK